MLELTTTEVQAHRIDAAEQLAARFQCAAILKGSGTVIAKPGQAPCINPTGNARLATAGTGDVLAGMVGARLAAGASDQQAACDAVYAHGVAADQWPSRWATGRYASNDHSEERTSIEQTLTASQLARRISW